jgi:hypothetical protein
VTLSVVGFGTETADDDMLAELRGLAERFRSRIARGAAMWPSCGRIDADEEAPADAGDGELAAATPRLRVLPLPAGEHPFLDEITATVEAAGQALAALVSDR